MKVALPFAAAILAGGMALSAVLPDDTSATQALIMPPVDGPHAAMASLGMEGSRRAIDDLLELRGGSEAEIPVNAPYCGTYAELSATLRHDFAEQPVVRGMTEQAEAAELWASDLMGTWTIVTMKPSGTGCILASGVNWEQGTDPSEIFELASYSG